MNSSFFDIQISHLPVHKLRLIIILSFPFLAAWNVLVAPVAREVHRLALTARDVW